MEGDASVARFVGIPLEMFAVHTAMVLICLPFAKKAPLTLA